jgi:Primase C terminal 1 (PriCT-1)
VLDVDSRNENDLADALARFGQSPFIVRTAGNGGFHAYYRHSGEKRGIKPEEGKPWDILANSLVVAPPTECVATGGSYKIIQGSLDALDDLPVMYDSPKIPDGRRNKELWTHCMRRAPHCDTFNDLLDVARTFNQNCEPPLDQTEVVRIARSARDYTEKGLNRFGKYSAYLPAEDVNKLIKQGKRAQDELLLTAFLKANRAPNATFIVANGLASTFGWPRKRLAAARKRLLLSGRIRRVAGPTGARARAKDIWFWWPHGGQK